MKLLICLLLFSASSAIAQDNLIKQDFETIIQYTREKKIDEVINMTYPKLFEIMPKAQMKAMANGMLTGMGVDMVFEENPPLLKLSPNKKLTNCTVCLGRYNQSTILSFKDKGLMDMMVNARIKDITYEKLGGNQVRMRGNQYLLAIKDASTLNTWKYLRYDDQGIAINSKVLSKEILGVVDL